MSVMSSGLCTRNLPFSTSTIPGPGQGLVEHVEIGRHGGGGMLVRQTQHLFDHPVMRHAETQRQSAPAHRLHRQGLMSKGDWVSGLYRHHGGPDLDRDRSAHR